MNTGNIGQSTAAGLLQNIVGFICIIGANAVAVKDVPENAVMGGVPAKIIGENTQHRLFKK